MMVDGYGNILPPLLPLLIPKLNLTLTAAGVLTMVYQLAASIAQIGFGHLADRWRPRILVMAGPVVAVSILSLIGIAPTVPLLAAVLVVGGLGSAAFHPPAAAAAHRLGGTEPGLAMSVHITGGTLGFALAPLLFAPAAQRFGLACTPFLAVPGLVVVALFLAHAPRLQRSPTHAGGLRGLRPYAGPLTILYVIVVLRTMTSLAFATYLPVLLTRRGMSIGGAGAAVAAFLFASGIGGLLGGPAADRFGARTVIGWSLALSTPFLAAAPMLSGSSFVLVLAAGGLFLQATLPVNVIFAQALAPVSAATVSSVMMGFAWGTGGLSVPIVGAVADRFGIAHALYALAFVPLFTAALALPLPASPAARGRQITA